MKGTLKEQIMGAVKSGKLKASEIENKQRKSKANRSVQTKRKVRYDKNDLSFMEKLVMVGIGESLSGLTFPPAFVGIDRFSERIDSARKEQDISDFKKFFCLAGLARLKPKECLKSEHFKQRIVIAAENIIERILLNVKMNKIDREDFEKTFETIQPIINFVEFGPVFIKYKEMKIQENQEKKFKEIRSKLSEYGFSDAETLYHENQDVIPIRQYKDLVEKHKAKQKREKVDQLRSQFEKFDFVSAKNFFQKYKEIIGNKSYEALCLEYGEKFSLEKLSEIIAPYLEKYDFSTADKLYAYSDPFRTPIPIHSGQ